MIVFISTVNIGIVLWTILRDRKDLTEIMSKAYIEGYRDACDSVLNILSTKALERGNDTSCVEIDFRKDTSFYILPASKDLEFILNR